MTVPDLQLMNLSDIKPMYYILNTSSSAISDPIIEDGRRIDIAEGKTPVHCRIQPPNKETSLWI
jgi:hypothetical protein